MHAIAAALITIAPIVGWQAGGTVDLQQLPPRHRARESKFVEGMARLSQRKSDMERKSQIQEIKEGRAMRERVYNNRNQPTSPKAPLPTKNAVRLSTVPSSAREKYNGGRD